MKERACAGTRGSAKHLSLELSQLLRNANERACAGTRGSAKHLSLELSQLVVVPAREECEGARRDPGECKALKPRVVPQLLRRVSKPLAVPASEEAGQALSQVDAPAPNKECEGASRDSGECKAFKPTVVPAHEEDEGASSEPGECKSLRLSQLMSSSPF